MAGTGTVGILRAVLTADATDFQKTLKKSADATTSFSKSVTELGKTTEKVTNQQLRLEKAFGGDKLLYTANNLTKAIKEIGGASKLTAQEQEKVNRQLTQAIEKYRVLGQQAPKAMLDLEKATRKTETATGALGGLLTKLGPAIVATFSVGAITAFAKEMGSFAGKMVDLSDQTKISTTRLQAFNYVGAGVGLT